MLSNDESFYLAEAKRADKAVERGDVAGARTILDSAIAESTDPHFRGFLRDQRNRLRSR